MITELFCRMCGEKAGHSFHSLVNNDEIIQWAVQKFQISFEVNQATKICTICYNNISTWLSFVEESNNCQETIASHLKNNNSELLSSYDKKSKISDLIKKYNIKKCHICLVPLSKEFLSNYENRKTATCKTAEKQHKDETKVHKELALRGGIHSIKKSQKTRKNNYKYNKYCPKNEENKCDFCGQQFRTSIIVRKHIVKMHPNEHFYCNFCKGKFRFKATITAHMLKTHLKNKEKKIYHCEHCSHKTNNRSNFCTHFFAMHVVGYEKKHKCSICCKLFASKSYKKTHEINFHGNLEKLFSCNLCTKSFKYQRSLTTHQYRHSGIKKNQCKKCPMRFFTGAELKNHTTYKHLNIRKYKCSICLKLFKTSTSLRNHEKIHSDKSSFKCNKCSKSFRKKISLESHISYLHNDARNYHCHICLKSFKVQSDLKKHVDTHNITLNFKCDLCTKCFKSRRCLTRHKILHKNTSVKCHDCNKYFKSKSTLRVHIICIHTGDFKPFQCNLCLKSYKIKASLKAHQVVHDDVYKYKCDICQKLFKWKDNCKKHVIMHSQRKGKVVRKIKETI